MPDNKKMSKIEFHQEIAKETNNGIWPVLDSDSPSAEELEYALHMAHTSRYHWSKVGTPVNLVRAEYMISRVYSAMNRGEPALFHAMRGLEIAEKAEETDNNFKDWDMPFVYEALAKAHATAGNDSECRKYSELAQKLIDGLSDPEDKKICQGELDKVSCK
jgi:hypothetical protein